MKFPRAFTSRIRFKDDSKRSPHWLETETPATMTRALAKVKSRSWRARGATIRTVKRSPPTLPSTVLFGLRVGNSRLRPKKRPAKYAPESEIQGPTTAMRMRTTPARERGNSPRCASGTPTQSDMRRTASTVRRVLVSGLLVNHKSAEGSSQRERLEGPRELVGGTRDDDEQDGEHGPLAEGYAGKRDRREHQGGRCPPPEHGSPRRRPGAWTVTRKTPGRAGTPQGRNRARACPSRRTRRRLSARAKSSIRAAPRWSGSPDQPRVRRGRRGIWRRSSRRCLPERDRLPLSVGWRQRSPHAHRNRARCKRRGCHFRR